MTSPIPKGPIRRVMSGLSSLGSGMWVTLKHLGRSTAGRKRVTELYPHKLPTLPPNYRSAIKLIRFPETDSHDCVGCKACERICPSHCISVDGDKVDGIKKKRATHFEMDFALCSLCGLCLDVCPTTTLEYSRGFDDAGYTRNWKHDLLSPFEGNEAAFVEAQRVREQKEAEEKARAAEEKKKAAEAAKLKKAQADKPSDTAAATPSDKPAATPSDRPAETSPDTTKEGNA